MMDERAAARLLGGEFVNGAILCPGPGHSPRDRSLRVWLLPTSSGELEIRVHSFAGDPWPYAKEDVARRLGLPADYWKQFREVDSEEHARWVEERRRAERAAAAQAEWKRERAHRIWDEAENPIGTPVQTYLNRERALDLPSDLAGPVLRYHPRCRWGEEFVPAMVAAIWSYSTGEFLSVHRVALTPNGKKIGRQALGLYSGGAIMLDALGSGRGTLTVGEGIETCMAARQLGLGPVWSLVSTANISTLPPLPGVGALTLLAENDGGGSAKACSKASDRWREASRTVELLWPPAGSKDLNDAVMEAAS